MVFDLDCNAGFRPKLILSLSGFGLFSLLLCSYTIGSSYLSVSGYGDWGLPGQELVVWLCLFGMVFTAVSVLGLFFKKIRCASLAAVIGAGMLVTFSVIALKSADQIRLQGFERLSREAAPLVAAIHAYHEEFGHPPKSLDGLQVNEPPGHTIKGGQLPEFAYLQGDRARERYHGNPWILMLETPTGPLRWDQFLYYPLQNYPSMGHGGWLETVGAWVYVHD
ncbi:MAG: hypothetical protein RQ722_01080 [Desulfuromonadales bacterium]|nr:hypothetical protein [Desulfuromonadales bacterium]